MTLTETFRVKGVDTSVIYFRDRSLLAHSNETGTKVLIKDVKTGDIIHTLKTNDVWPLGKDDNFVRHEDFLLIQDDVDDIDTFSLFDLEKECLYPIEYVSTPRIYIDNRYLVFECLDENYRLNKLCFFDTQRENDISYPILTGCSIEYPTMGLNWYQSLRVKGEGAKFPTILKVNIEDVRSTITISEFPAHCKGSKASRNNYSLGKDDFVYFEGIEQDGLLLSRLTYKNELLRKITIKGVDFSELQISKARMYYRSVSEVSFLLFSIRAGAVRIYRLINLDTGECIWSFDSYWDGEPDLGTHLGVIVHTDENNKIQGYYLMSFRTGEVDYYSYSTAMDINFSAIKSISAETLILADTSGENFVGYDVSYN